ncbi:right-handed parallel beta-helix repeat-containing protein [Conexibacter arvalis]|uniref:Right handed beta helix domain-containing protein n=1 Tax=Conexibacter arvalis TaxID=912552 RepID=A0A840IBM4_9ACTN|nr:right-handed parallel beta-helix repeat-containing protein [Conexibacter arvalis]MBB4661651.1 hypothetical protein [Conexibacter arvalis]
MRVALPPRRLAVPLVVAALAALAAVVALVSCDGALAARTFHVSPDGDDRAAGTASEPWRSLARVNRARLRPGDRVLLRGGAEFRGQLRLGPDDAGARGRAVAIGSYGGGRATIRSGRASAVLVLNAGRVRVSDLRLVGSGPLDNRGSGVEFRNTLPRARRLTGISIARVEASGFGVAGIAVHGRPADRSQSGFRTIRISDCVAHDNRRYGVYVGGIEDRRTRRFANADARIDRCRAYDNHGDPRFTANHSGSGIFLSNVDGGAITHSVAHDNGSLNACRNCGPVGIWAAIARDVTIERNESYRNRSGPGGRDGDGFDLDGGTIGCVVQHNYSHDNDGAGFMVYNWTGAPHEVRGNVVRFNISQDDSRRGGLPAILVGNDGSSNAGTRVHNNTVYLSPPPGGRPAAIGVYGTTSALVANNVLYTTGGLPLVDAAADQPGLRFRGNLYWTAGEPFSVTDAGRRHGSLEAWRAATGQERVDGRAVGRFADPLLVDAGGGPTIDDPRRLTQLDAYRPRPESPIRGAGVDAGAPGPADYFGAPLRRGGPFALGAALR